MSVDVTHSLKSELIRLGEQLKKNSVWPSPTHGLARHLLKVSLHDEDQHLKLTQIVVPSESFDTAPVLASAGYALGLSNYSDADAERWGRAFRRLMRSEPFPRDRQTFVYRPAELLGLALGIHKLGMREDGSGRWLQSVILRIHENKPHNDIWTSLLYHHAASVFDISMNIEVPAQMAVFDLCELCLLKILLSHKQIAAFSEFDQEKTASLILQKISTNNFDDRGHGKLAAVYAGLFLSIRSQFQKTVTTPNFNYQQTPEMKKLILFLAANPDGETPLSLDEECREITQKIRAAQHRDSLELISHWAVRPEDLLQYFNQHKPHIVHFSGHGSLNEEIVLLDKNRNAKPVPPAAIKQLFSTLKDNVRVVLLNACYSQSQAEAIVEVIDCAIGMKKAIGDEAAITFAAAFYQAIGFGRSIESAFQSGKTALMLESIPEENTPELLSRKGVDPAQVFLFPPSH